MDTDFTHNPKEIPRLLHVAELYDIVSGSRFCPGGLMQSTNHYLCSLTFNWFVRIILRTQIQDNTGGYFTMRRAKLLALPLNRIFFGYGDYYFRLLHYAQQQGCSIVEIPAQYISRTKGQSKSNFIRMLFKYTTAMLHMKWQILRDMRSS
jgi:dolichol-phosphate mannosyltransferase